MQAKGSSRLLLLLLLLLSLLLLLLKLLSSRTQLSLSVSYGCCANVRIVFTHTAPL